MGGELMKQVTLKELLSMRLDLIKSAKQRWHEFWESHYLASGDAEDKAALQAQADAIAFRAKAAVHSSKRAALR